MTNKIPDNDPDCSEVLFSMMQRKRLRSLSTIEYENQQIKIPGVDNHVHE